ncbi:MAG: ABC-2 transporter permease [Oscillospiraceae bacterium]|nr:ABC-2 transporter permease [Oscillospiraceae bacterium]
MLNMIKLDWLGMKCYHKRFVIIPLTISLYGFFHIAAIIPMITFMMFSFSVNPFAVEEKGKLDNLYLTLPVTRGSIVKARFGLSFIMQLIGLAAGVIFTVVLSSVFYGRTIIYPRTFYAGFSAMFLIICGSILFYAVLNLSTFPVLFNMGYAKGKLIGFIIPIIFVSVVIAAFFVLWSAVGIFREWFMSAFIWASGNAVLVAAIMLTAAVLLLAVSYTLSQKFFSKREF